MKSETREWIEKAEKDFHSARLLLRARTHVDYDGACFHAQQSAEKYMKAALCEAAFPFERIHDLPRLLDELVKVNGLWEALREAATTLADYAVRFRYPGCRADQQMARQAVRACEFIRGPMRNHLGIEPTTRKGARKKSTPKRGRTR